MSDPRTPAQDSAIDQIVGAASGSPTFNLADPNKINSAVLAALLERCPPEYLADRVYRLIEAKRQTKSGEEDDVRANEAGLKLALAYSIGKPIERQQIAVSNVTADPDADLASRLKKSPALRRMMKRMISEAEADEIEVETIV